MSVQTYTCSCGKIYLIGTIGTLKKTVYRDHNGDAVEKCKCGKELK